MKILLITNTLQKIDGWAQVGTSLYEHWKQSGHTIDVISEMRHPHDGISLRTNFPRKPNRNIFQELNEAIQLKKKLGSKKYDILVCNIEPLICLARRLAQLVECERLLLIGHGTYAYYPFLEHKKLRKAAEIFEIVCPSKFTQNKIYEWSHRSARVIPWGVNNDKYKHFGLKRQPFFLSVGEQKPRKGTELALLAFQEFIRNHPQFKYVFAGKVSSHLLEIVDKLKLNKSVILLGVVDDLKLIDLYNTATAHILPSHNTPSSFEGFGLVHLEANACGCPSVGSRNTANEEVIKNNESGYLIDTSKPDELLEAMRALTDTQHVLNLLSYNALKHASGFKWKTAAESILEES